VEDSDTIPEERGVQLEYALHAVVSSMRCAHAIRSRVGEHHRDCLTERRLRIRARNQANAGRAHPIIGGDDGNTEL
jgi:hypothetical protein